MMNNGLAQLHAYPFERLHSLLQDCTVTKEKSAISLAIGEPKHPTPVFILETLRENLKEVAVYPATRGIPELRLAIAQWLHQRYSLPVTSIDPDKHILPVNGTREALFAISQAIIDRNASRPLVLLPNPFYQIYEGAALLAGAEPYYLNCSEENGFMPDLDTVPKGVWQNCQLIYLCSPGNPSGATVNKETVGRLLDSAEKYDFVIASDECYSEIYLDESNPPGGLLEYAKQLGNDTYARCLVFHSLSKRSNLPGLRSGFVAGDETLIHAFFNYRTYHGCAMPLHVQKTSIAAWGDETHVLDNRDRYREKFRQVTTVLNPVLPVHIPPASFYLWPKLPESDIDFARKLYTGENVRLLPGSYLSREINHYNPGSRRARIALVAELDECVEAANRMKTFIETTY